MQKKILSTLLIIALLFIVSSFRSW